MAEIFISYSKTDQAEVRLLAAFLEAQGYSVWWDTSLLSGDNFRLTIMKELARARAAIVIWTENSVTSDWVMSEAGRAHADQKLIPVKARGLEYKDIPPPFDNQHTENLDAHENILAAVQGQLAKAPTPSPFWKKARYELLTWFGIVGTAVTLLSQIEGWVRFTKVMQILMENWRVWIKAGWEKIFMILDINVPEYAISGMTAAFFLFLVSVGARIRLSSVSPLRERIASTTDKEVITLLVPVTIITLAIFFDTLFNFSIMEIIIASALSSIGFVIGIFILPVEQFSACLWRIIALCSVIVVLNLAFFWIEQQL